MKTHLFPALLLTAVAVGAVDGTERGTLEPDEPIEVVALPALAKENAALVEASVTSGFAAKLTPDERASAGLEKLSGGQRATLDALIAKEVKAARQGNVRGFAGTFISRRTDEERAAAGMGILTTSEKYQLDRLVSRALATQPAQPPMAIARPPSEAELLLKTKSDWETHGFVQLEYGFGSGDREYKAGTVAVTSVNPRTGTAFTFAYTVAEGDGLWWNRGCETGWRRRYW